MFYAKLKALCEAKGLDITPFVESLGMSTGNLTSWSKGAEPRNSTKKRIADALGVDVSVFSEAGAAQNQPAPKQSNLWDKLSDILGPEVEINFDVKDLTEEDLDLLRASIEDDLKFIEKRVQRRSEGNE